MEQKQDSFVEVEFTVEPNYAGWRLDKYLRIKIPRLSRARIQRIIQKSLLCENKLKPSSLVRPGLTFRLRRPPCCVPRGPLCDPRVATHPPASLQRLGLAPATHQPCHPARCDVDHP